MFSGKTTVAGIVLILAWASAPGLRAQPPSTAKTDQFGDPLPAGALRRFGTTRLRAGDFMGRVMRVEFADDGKGLFVWRSGYLGLWDLNSGKLVRELLDRGQGVSAVSPDGKTIAFDDQGGFGEIALLDTATGKKRFELKGHKSVNVALAFSPDGKQLASGGFERTVRIWDLATGRQLHKLDQTAMIVRLAFSPDGKYLAVRIRDGAVQLFDAAAGTKLASLTSPEGSSLSFAPDSERLALAGADGTVRVWRTATGKELRCLARGAARCDSVAFSSDGKLLASGHMDRSVRLWDTATGREIRAWKAAVRGIYGLAFSPDNQLLASGGGSCVQLWTVATGAEAQAHAGHHAAVEALRFGPDAGSLYSADGEGVIINWNFATGRKRSEALVDGVGDLYLTRVTFSPAAGFAAGLAWNEKGKRLVPVWDIATGKEVLRISTAATNTLAFSPDARSLALGGKNVLLCDTKTGKQKHMLRPVKTGVGTTIHPLDLAFTPDGTKLAAALWKGEDGKGPAVRMWEVSTWQELPAIALDHDANSIAFSPNGNLMAVAGGRSLPATLSVWNMRRNQLLFKSSDHRHIPIKLAFSPTGRFLASAGSWRPDDAIYLWETATGQQVLSFRHRSGVGCLLFSPDARTLVSGGGDGSVLAWDVANGQRGRPKQPLTSAELEARWRDLAGHDARKAYRASWELAAAGEQTLAILQTSLQPASLPDTGTVAQLLADLDNRSFSARERAAARLEKLGDVIEPALRKALARPASLETKQRLERILKTLDALGSHPERLREIRAIEIAEHIGTPEACGLLDRLAHGAPDSRLTREARASLDRLRRAVKR